MKFRWETEFKETEIGEIPRDWEVGKLGNFVDIIRGVSFSKEHTHFEQFNNCIALLRANNIAKDGSLRLEDLMYIPKEIVKEEQFIRELDIIMVASSGNKDLVGKFAQIKEIPFTGGLTFGAFNFCIRSQRIEKLFLKFLLSSEIIENQLEEVVDGTNINNLRINDLKNFKIPFPPLPEQARIATVLSWFDDLIEVKKKQNEILEKTAMAIFKSWFIDFEPFKDEEFVYNEELGREIPKGWEVDKTTRLIEYNPSITMKKGEIYPFIEMKDVKTNSLLCEPNFKQFSGSGVRYYGGDTLMARITPSLEHGKTAFIWFISEKEKGFGSTEFFVLHPKESYLKEFVYLLAKNDDFREIAINSMSGTSGRQRVDINALKNYNIPIPPPHILQSFHSLVEPLFQKIILNQKQITTLRKIRDTLLPLLVFGKLRVEEL